MKLAECDATPNLSAELDAQQSALDLALLEQSKAQADGEAQLAERDSKEYTSHMSDSFTKQVVSSCNTLPLSISMFLIL